MEESPPDTEKAARSNAGERSFGAIPAGLLKYLEARGVLLSIEGQEAVQQLLRILLRAVLAAIFGLGGWMMLMAGIVSYLALQQEWTWTRATVAGGMINLVLAAAFAFAAWRRLGSARWFEHTLNEFGKDRKWLDQLNDKH